MNQTWLTLPLGNIHNGDTIRVWGNADASGTVTAQIVRDISVSAAGTLMNQ